MKSRLTDYTVWPCLFACLLHAAVATAPVYASSFEAMVSPPRFELQADPGETLRQIVTIQNAGDRPATFSLRTADWDLSADGGLTIHPPQLQPGSCRPWARIERRSLRLPAQGLKRFRFEIQVPDDAPAGECRLALLVEPGEDAELMARARNIRFPIEGRIAVIIYVGIGDAQPRLEVRELRLDDVNGRPTPVAVLHNSGTAHGRPEGFLQGSDASGRRLDFTVAATPVLPGQTRAIPIWQAPAEGTERVDLQPPLTVRGVIEWQGGEQRVEAVLE
jgi:fimbrial chaperone protein